MLHGRLVGGLGARALEQELAQPGWRVARLTVDLVRPAGMVPVTVTTQPLRRGRRIRVGDALVHSGGHLVGRVTAVVLVEGVEPPGSIWRPDHEPWPDPDTLGPDDAAGPDDDHWTVRTVAGGFGTGARTRLWTNDRAGLVDDEAMTPLVRAAVSGDLGCPVTNASDAGLHYINADYTLALGRYPVGPWIGVEAAEQVAADGISVASATLYDRAGAFATTTGSSIATEPLDAE